MQISKGLHCIPILAGRCDLQLVKGLRGSHWEKRKIDKGHAPNRAVWSAHLQAHAANPCGRLFDVEVRAAKIEPPYSWILTASEDFGR